MSIRNTINCIIAANPSVEAVSNNIRKAFHGKIVQITFRPFIFDPTKTRFRFTVEIQCPNMLRTMEIDLFCRDGKAFKMPYPSDYRIINHHNSGMA